MRCQICNTKLENYELTKRDVKGNLFLDTCNKCLSSIHKIANEYEDDFIKDIQKPLDTD